MEEDEWRQCVSVVLAFWVPGHLRKKGNTVDRRSSYRARCRAEVQEDMKEDLTRTLKH